MYRSTKEERRVYGAEIAAHSSLARTDSRKTSLSHIGSFILASRRRKILLLTRKNMSFSVQASRKYIEKALEIKDKLGILYRELGKEKKLKETKRGESLEDVFFSVEDVRIRDKRKTEQS